MPLFQYKEVTPSGKITKQFVNAESLDLAKELLRQQNKMVSDVTMAPRGSRKNKLPKGVVLSFTRDLSQMLSAGLPLYDSLIVVSEKYQKSKAYPMFLDLCDKVKHGMLLSKSMQFYPDVFDRVYISMIASAEETGRLSYAFSHLERLITKEQKLKKQLQSSMVYPAILIAFCVVVITALFLFLIPSMKELFEGRDLHPMTQSVLAISEGLNEYGAFLGVGVLLLGFIGTVFFKSEKGKRFFYKVKLSLPFIRTLTTTSVIIRFSRSLSMMLSSSVPMVQALELSKKVMKNPFFEEVIEKAQKGIIQGKLLSEELSKSSLIPQAMIRMISLAEETGNLEQMLESLSEIYEENLERSLQRFATLLQPVVLMFLATIVGVVMLSVLLPLTDVGSFLSD